MLLLLLLLPLHSQLTHNVIISMHLSSTICIQYNRKRVSCAGAQSLYRQAARVSESLLARRKQD